jgi:riboflavin synthase
VFSGIVEELAKVVDTSHSDGNLHLWIKCRFIEECHIDQSIAHNGVCLTIDQITNGLYRITAIEETLNKTNLSSIKAGDFINLERSLTLDNRLDGHLVQGHVDCTVKCLERKELEGSWVYRFDYPSNFSHWIVLKGSICIDGVSLTVSDLSPENFEVSIIPYTYENTRFQNIHTGDYVNIEFDIIGKYVARNMEAYINKI